MAARHPQPEGGKLRVRVVRRVAVGTEGHAIVQPRQLLLDLLGQLRIWLDLRLSHLGTVYSAHQLIPLRLEGRKATLLLVIQRRTLIGPASLVILPSQEAHCHGLDELFVVHVSQAIQEHDGKGERVSVRAGDAGVADDSSSPVDRRIIGCHAAFQQS